MREFTVQEVIEYAQRIETESCRFYKSSVKIVKDHEAVKLVEELAREEERHYNRLRGLLHQDKIAPMQLETRITLGEAEYMDKIVATGHISQEASARNILSIALEREENTERLYAMLLTITNLSQTIIDVFESLRNQERVHASRISSMIKRLAS